MIRGQTPYRIQGFGRLAGTSGAAGFSVVVPIEFADEARKWNRPETVDKMLKDYAREIWPRHMEWMGGEDHIASYIDKAFRFDGDTYLLTNLNVPGNACGLDQDRIFGAPWSASYGWTPHNVDSPSQASALLSMWIRWFDCVEATFHGK